MDSRCLLQLIVDAHPARRPGFTVLPQWTLPVSDVYYGRVDGVVIARNQRRTLLCLERHGFGPLGDEQTARRGREPLRLGSGIVATAAETVTRRRQGGLGRRAVVGHGR